MTDLTLSVLKGYDEAGKWQMAETILTVGQLHSWWISGIFRHCLTANAQKRTNNQGFAENSLCVASANLLSLQDRWNMSLYVGVCVFKSGIVSLRASIVDLFWVAVEQERYWGACETCTASMKHAQLLWIMQNFYETFTSRKYCKKLLTILHPFNYVHHIISYNII